MRRLTHQFALLIFVLGALGVASGTARAGLIVSSETVTATPGSTGFVQILLQNDFASPQTLSAFSVEIALGGSDVLFTGVDNLTSPPYVFDGFGTGILTFDVFPNTGFIESDVSLNSDGFVTLAAGETVGLGRISFEVDGSAAAGLRPITFTPGPTTLFIDAAGTPYADSDVLLSAGGIDVQGSAVVPEPSTAVVFLVLSGCGLFVAWGRQRRHERRGCAR